MAELVVYATIDGWMNGVTPDTNMGAGISVGVAFLGGGKSRLDRTIGNFDVSPLAGMFVRNAQLERYVTALSGGGFGARIYRCTRSSSWTEAGLTWNKYDGANAWMTPGGDFDPAAPAPLPYTEATGGGWHTISGLAGFVVDALANRGGLLSIIMKSDDEAPPSSAYVDGVDRTGGNAWRLRVTYEAAEPGRRAAFGEASMLSGVRGRRAGRGVAGASPAAGVSPVGPRTPEMEVRR